MEKQRKNLKAYSVVILICVALSLIRMIADACINGFGDISMLPEGTSEDVALVAFIIVWVLGIIFLLPQVYLGVRGIKQANKPTKGRAHIVWAFILTVCAIISTVSEIIVLTNGYSFDKLLALINVLVNVLLFGEYYLAARQISNKL